MPTPRSPPQAGGAGASTFASAPRILTSWKPGDASSGACAQLRRLRDQRQPALSDPVFCGLAGRRLQPKILANIIRRAAERAGLEKRVTAHTLRHTAATWLRQATGDARLVADYLGHADLSTVSRYAHVAGAELHEAAETLAIQAGLEPRVHVVEEEEREAA